MTSQEILAAVQEALDIPREDLPKVKRREQPPPGVAPTMELLKVLLKAKCDQEGIASRLIATADDLEKLAMDDEADIQALKGWRRELFGEDALDLKHGRLALTVGKSSVKIMPVSDV